jgi:hypothetical protein
MRPSSFRLPSALISLWPAGDDSTRPGSAGVRPGTPDGASSAGRLSSRTPFAGGGTNPRPRARAPFPALAPLLALGLLIAPAAFAMTGANTSVLDLSTGVPANLLGKTMGLARGLFTFALVVGLVLEFVGGSPTSGRDYGGCVFRALVVVMLLAFYGRIFGSLVNMAENVASQIAPQSIWEDYTKAQGQWQQKLFSQQSDADRAAQGTVQAPQSLTDRAKKALGLAGGLMGGYLFDSLIAVFLLVAEGAHWVLVTFAHILSAMLYVIGPLALVFAIPRASDTGHRWFRIFITVLTWPIFAALLLALTTAIGLTGMTMSGASTAFGSVCAALLMTAIVVATPVVASHFVGGTTHFVSHGTQALHRYTAQVVDGASGHARAAWKRFRGTQEDAAGASEKKGRGHDQEDDE